MQKSDHFTGRVLACLGMGCVVLAWSARGAELFVATDGNNGWNGRAAAPNAAASEGPFASLERARNEARKIHASHPAERVTISIRGGRYELSEPFTLGAEDSGKPEHPVVYRAFPGERVILTGARQIREFSAVTNAQVLARLPAEARHHVVVADLKQMGLTNYGKAVAPGERPELFFHDQPMTLARWPNEGFVRVERVLGDRPFSSHGIKGNHDGHFAYEGQEPERWRDEPEVWLHGYWFWDWSDSFQRVASIDPAKREIILAPPQHGYGYRAGQRYYALNLLSELDAPGEWYLDREQGCLYFWPPGALEDDPPTLSVLGELGAFQGCFACRGARHGVGGGARHAFEHARWDWQPCGEMRPSEYGRLGGADFRRRNQWSGGLRGLPDW